MIQGGNATIYVSDMDRAVTFYTETLGLKLKDRYGNEWAAIDAGDGLILGLHPQSEHSPAGRSGSISVGFLVTESIDQVVARLTDRGVTFRGPVQGDPQFPIRLAFFGDPDGNDLYLCQVQS